MDVLIPALVLTALALVALRGMFARTDLSPGRKIGWVLAIMISCGLIPAAYGLWDLWTRQDIDGGRKALWALAFVITVGYVLVFYGLVALSTSELLTGADPKPRGA